VLTGGLGWRTRRKWRVGREGDIERGEENEEIKEKLKKKRWRGEQDRMKENDEKIKREI
jgi:hypothetical protein